MARLFCSTRVTCLLGQSVRSAPGRLQSWRTQRGRAFSESKNPRLGDNGRLSELDRADAWMMRKAQETGFLSWLRNGFLATGIGVVSYMQSDVGREAAYGFFMLGGLCISYGTASHIANTIFQRRAMLLTSGGVVLQCVLVGSLTILWISALSVYLGHLEVEIVHDDGNDDGRGEDDAGSCNECESDDSDRRK
uniref:transmembrane protein 160 n=1 Tax=Myxine glutinosa TaxID=7769 RepID=UPI00358F0830